jgi:putative transcriptional regulator
MTISHHLDHATLVAFSAGTLPANLSMVVQAHLEMCPACRHDALAADEIGGALLDDHAGFAVSAESKSAVMDKIQTATLHRMPKAKRAHSAGGIPRVLHAALGTNDLNAIKWRKSGPGIAVHKLPQQSGDTGFLGLLRISPGYKVPDHGHGGTELTLIISGAYHDQIGYFAAGDIADLDESVLHTPVVAGDEDCICLAANDAPTRFHSWPARLLQRFAGI